MLEGLHDPPQSEEDVSHPNGDHFFKNEFLVASIYTPNMATLRKLQEEGMPIAVAIGADSGNASYARTTYVQRDLIGCQHHRWPSEHLVYQVDPKAFADALLSSIDKSD